MSAYILPVAMFAVPISRYPARRRLPMALAGAVLATLLLPPLLARAVILPAQIIDGPSEEIVGFGGVAMAEDGTGGVVYLKRVDGVAHVFVARYAAGHWMPPIRVDTEQPYAASWPCIGAADGGELVVVWATPFATEKERPVEELLGATLGPGAEQFGQAMIVDPNIREGTGTSPDLAMSATGQSDVVYRVVKPQGSTTLLHPGDVVESIRVAHFDGRRWAQLGAINRDPALSMPPPTPANAPQIGIGPTGNGVVVWQEPEITGEARIWARRVLGQSLDYVMPVSAESFGGAPIGQNAEAPSVAISRLGQAEVAYRQSWAKGSPLPGPRVFINTLPDGESASGAEFQGAMIADPDVTGGGAAEVGRPSIDIDEKRSMRLLYDDNGTPRVIEGNDKGALTASLSLGSPFVVSPPAKADELPSASVMDPEGGGISAYPSATPAGTPAVAVREDFPGGGVQTGLLSGAAGGPIGEIGIGRSGLGDGIVAFQQGALGNAAIVVAQVTSPPAGFLLNVPKGWVKPSQARVSWAPALSANGPLSYTVVLDGRRLPAPAGASSFALNPRGLGDGVHQVQLLATDISGQAALSPVSTLKIDGEPPTVKIARADGEHGVTVRVRDDESGVNARAVSVSFGDGHSRGGRSAFNHRYAHPGVYRVVVRVQDKLGNRGVISELVSVR